MEVDFDPYPAQKGGFTDPSWDAGVDIEEVRIGDVCIDELLESAQFDFIAVLVMEAGKDCE